jgi:hypothetical protein
LETVVFVREREQSRFRESREEAEREQEESRKEAERAKRLK